jgi:hypothetical protein
VFLFRIGNGRFSAGAPKKTEPIAASPARIRDAPQMRNDALRVLNVAQAQKSYACHIGSVDYCDENLRHGTDAAAAATDGEWPGRDCAAIARSSGRPTAAAGCSAAASGPTAAASCSTTASRDSTAAARGSATAVA